ncbi:MAG: diguanylate cyclase [Chloroflexi bacterium]|nr:diguanylate cyclase [Chloroflexota bacterium]
MSTTRILIVEDEMVAAKILELRLTRLGYTPVGIVPSGEQAIETARTLQPDLVLMDIDLSGALDGVQAAEQIRAQFDLPVIFTTAHSDAETLERAKITEAFGYLVKPFDPRDLHNAIEIGLYKHTIERRLKESEERYRLISELTSDFAYSVRVDATGRGTTEWVTDAFYSILGYTQDELNAHRSFLSFVHPDDQTIFRERWKTLGAGENYVGEYRLVTKRGETRWLRDYARPVWDAAAQRIIRVHGAAQDITERKHTAEEIALQRARFQQLFENAPIAIALLDAQDRITSINHAFADLFQYVLAECAGRAINELIVPPNLFAEAERLSHNVTHGIRVDQESVRQRKDGTRVPVQMYGVPILTDSQTSGIFAIYVDISERKQREQHLEYLSTHDALTGLYNRAYFETEVARLEHSRSFPVSIVMGDVDGLKQTNDSRGHSVGDELLRDAARVLRDAFRGEDIVARIGGDEFAILLPATDAAQIQQIMLRVRQAIQAYNASAHALPLSFSLGVVTAEQGAALSQALIEADTAMYQEKAAHHQA